MTITIEQPTEPQALGTRAQVPTPYGQASIVVRTWQRGTTNREMQANTRVYPGDELARANSLTLAALDAVIAARSYASDANSTDPQVVELYKVRNAAYAKGQVRVATAAVDWLIDQGHLRGVRARPVARFSVRAGCSVCDCSPGVILDTRMQAALTGVVTGPVDVWLKPAVWLGKATDTPRAPAERDQAASAVPA